MCYEIGFGIVRDPCKSEALIERCHEYDRMNFARELQLVKNNHYGWSSSKNERLSSNYRKMSMAPTSSLPLSYLRQGVIKEIEVQYRREISDAEHGLRPNHVFVLILQKELSNILLQSGKKGEAENLKAQIRDTEKKISEYNPSRDVGIGANLSAIISLSEQPGRAKDAEELCSEIFAQTSSMLGANSFTAAEALWTQAIIAANHARWEEAERLSLQSLGINVRELGETHPDNIVRAHVVALIFGKQEKWDEAETLVTRSMQRSIKILGDEHNHHISGKSHLAWIQFLREKERPPHLRQWAAIETQQIEVMKGFIKVHEQENITTVITMNNLTAIWSEQRLWRIAKVLFEQVIQASKKFYGEEHPETLKNMENMLSVLYEIMKRKDTLAKITGRQTCYGPIYCEAFELSAKIRGWDDLRTVNLATWVRGMLMHQRKFQKAEILQTRIMETRKRIQGVEHEDILDEFRCLAIIVRKQVRLREALKVLEKYLHNKPLFARLGQRAQLCLGLRVV